MIARRLVSLLLGALASAALVAPVAGAAPLPAFSVHSVAVPTNFEPGEVSGADFYEVTVANNGAEVTNGDPITIVDTLPEGLTVQGDVELFLRKPEGVGDFGSPPNCKTVVVGEVSTVTCTITEAILEADEPATIWPSEELRMVVHVAVPLSASGALTNLVEVNGGGVAKPAGVESHNQASALPAAGGFQEFHAEVTGEDGEPVRQAAGRVYQYTTSFAVNTELAPAKGSQAPFVPAGGDLKDIEVKLPPGLIGNPRATALCSAQQFNTIHGVAIVGFGNQFQNECPDGSVVGLAVVQQVEGNGGILPVPLYNLVPPQGMPAQLGFQILGVPFYIDTSLRSDGDYGISAHVRNTSEAKRVTAFTATIWGTPADESHDRLRGSCLNGNGGAFSLGSCSAERPPEPFWRLPTSCAAPLTTTMSFNTWLHPSIFAAATETEAAPLGCEQVPFDPSIEAKPTTNVADAPSGLHFDLHLPQAENEDPEGLGEADLREATVTLPEGLLVNPASADGLAGCSELQVGYEGVREGRQSFYGGPTECPDASKLGTVEVKTLLLDHPLPGAVYLANPHENPFNSLLAIYIAVEDPQSGVNVTLAGRVEPDPQSGQLTTTVDESPQLPFEDFRFHFFEGARAPLRTPAFCGAHTTTASLVPWTTPAGATATPSSSFQITQAPGGGCPATPGAEPNAPSLQAGTQTPTAGAFSPFVLKLHREDGSQEPRQLSLTLPPGLTGRLAGVRYCPEAALAAAQAKSGKAEQASPSCPAASQLGTVTVGAGAGPAPYYVQGRAYLAGPYQGAPLSMAIITPAVAGPFDLGTVVVRAALQVDPETARITAVSPIPAILQGIPLDVRSIALRIDRPGFTLNPTSCDPLAFSGSLLSTLGNPAPLTQRFQVGECAALGFSPKLSLRLKGGTKRGAHPALTATLTMPPGSAGIAAAQVALPHTEFLAQEHIRTVCTRVQFAAGQCPPAAIYGYARAVTPLLEAPLQGPVYLRSSSHKLPDLVADLNGQIQIVLHGRTDTVNGGIRNTFEALPDAPVSSFTLELQGAKKGLLVNSTDICKGAHRASAVFTAHSGKVAELRPKLAVRCKGHRGHKRRSRR